MLAAGFVVNIKNSHALDVETPSPCGMVSKDSSKKRAHDRCDTPDGPEQSEDEGSLLQGYWRILESENTVAAICRNLRVSEMMTKQPEKIPATPVPATALPPMRTELEVATPHIREPSSKTKMATKKLHLICTSFSRGIPADYFREKTNIENLVYPAKTRHQSCTRQEVRAPVPSHIPNTFELIRDSRNRRANNRLIKRDEKDGEK